jgi:hypothetical protein
MINSRAMPVPLTRSYRRVAGTTPQHAPSRDFADPLGPHPHGWGRGAGAGRVQPPAAPPPCDAGTGPARPARTAAPHVRRYHDQEQVNEHGHGGGCRAGVVPAAARAGQLLT